MEKGTDVGTRKRFRYSCAATPCLFSTSARLIPSIVHFVCATTLLTHAQYPESAMTAEMAGLTSANNVNFYN